MEKAYENTACSDAQRQDDETTGLHGVDPSSVSALEGVKFLGKVEAPENCMYKYREENLVREGDFAVFMD